MKIEYTHGISADQNKKFVLASGGGKSSTHYFYGDTVTEHIAKEYALADLVDQFQSDVYVAAQAYAAIRETIPTTKETQDEL